LVAVATVCPTAPLAGTDAAGAEVGLYAAGGVVDDDEGGVVVDVALDDPVPVTEPTVCPTVLVAVATVDPTAPPAGALVLGALAGVLVLGALAGVLVLGVLAGALELGALVGADVEALVVEVVGAEGGAGAGDGAEVGAGAGVGAGAVVAAVLVADPAALTTVLAA
jgi:hypothetical protein